jgi:DNA repair protein RecN (Recombination protein N)
MLKQLNIQNLAIIDEVDLDFNKGMTVLTGETGAGKSILIDALGLVLGDRGDSSLIRENSERSEILATFDVRGRKELHNLLEDQSIDSDSEELVIRRVISRDGRSKAYVNSSPVPVQLLRTIGENLIDIHGQHAHQSLMNRSIQRSLFDYYAAHQTILNDVNSYYDEWKSINDKYIEITNDSGSHEASIELLQYQVKELEDLSLKEDEYDTLEDEHRRLSNIKELIDVTRSVLETLSENEISVESSLQRAVHDIKTLSKSDPETEKFVNLLNNISIQLTDALEEIRHYFEKLEDDPQRLNELENRLNTLYDMARKHQVKPENLEGHFRVLQDKLHQLVSDRDSVQALVEQRDRALDKYHQAAQKLHKGRLKAAVAMAREISGQLNLLGMPDGEFQVNIEQLDPGHPLRDGLDLIEFLVSLNPGTSPQPLRKVASGGELSRISLAIQMACKDAKTAPTLIFDEVDAGIGGRTADILANLLKDISDGHQVFCVTHLPQVASRADNHLLVDKYSKKDSTYAQVSVLNVDDRVEEIARMLGGMRVSEKTREHAREMLGHEVSAA